MDKQRTFSYGERRKFSRIERCAIGLRMQVVVDALAQLRSVADGETLSVLELGCGYRANNLQYLQQHYPEMEFSGVDLTIDSKLSQQSDIEIFEADLNGWQPEKKYACVLSLAVAEHLLDMPMHFQLIADCLHENGTALITTPTPPAHALLSFLAWLNIFDSEEIQDHKLYLTGEGLHALAEEAGLAVYKYCTFSMGMNQFAVLTAC